MNKIFISIVVFLMAFSQGCSDPFPDGDISLLYGILSERVSKPRMLFVTSGTFTGDLDFDRNGSGVNDADKICYDEKNTNFGFLPGPGTEYKAMIVDGNSTRKACNSGNCTSTSENINWVMSPNTSYGRIESAGAAPTIIFTTNTAGIITTNLENPFHSVSLTYWTGLASTWTGGGACSGNSWNTESGLATFGNGVSLTNTAWFNIGGTCNTLKHLVCVQQSSL